MGQRLYNVFFHTHTVSGIIISAALYVIFFAGSVSFLRDEINAWQRDEPVTADFFHTADFDRALDSLSSTYDLYGRDLNFNQYFHERRLGVSMSTSKDTTLLSSTGEGGQNAFFYMNMGNFEHVDYDTNYSLGEFLYRLHFFAQLNLWGRSGYLLSGFVAFFFLFAILTGIIVHWKKVRTNFYVFRPGAKWKTIWTDAHVGLGVIGLPYQFMFAVTGCYLMLGYALMLPPVQALFYSDKPEEFAEVLQFGDAFDPAFHGEKLAHVPAVNDLVQQTHERWPDAQFLDLDIKNYGDTNMYVTIHCASPYDEALLATGFIRYRAIDGEVTQFKNPNAAQNYRQGSVNLLKRLHYGDYGGYGVKFIYLILGFVTCFVIISGVMIWLVARDKKAVAPVKRRFNNWLGRIYLSICLSMYPVTAFTFAVVKCFGESAGESPKVFIYQVFFWSWLALSTLLVFNRKLYNINRICLLLGSVLAFAVPLSNGIMTGNWLWVSWEKGYTQIFVVDLFWLLMAVTSSLVLVKLKRK